MLGRLVSVLTVTAALLASGCVAPDGLVRTATDEAVAPTPRALYLTGDLGLTPVAPDGGSPELVRGGSFFTRWGQEGGFVEFVGEPLGETLHVTGPVKLTAHARAEGVALQAGVFPHFIAYFGTDLSLNSDGSADASAALLPGDEVEFTVDLELPPAGLVLERGARPRVLLVAVMTQDDRADIAFLVGSAQTPTRVEFSASRIADPPLAGAVTTISESGTLVGSAYATTEGGVAQTEFPLDVPAGASLVHLDLNVGGAAGFGDIDFAVLDAAGETVARGVTPTGVEAIRLHPVHLGDRSAFRIVVTNYGSAAATFTLEGQVAVTAGES